MFLFNIGENESTITRRSIRVPPTSESANESRSRSPSSEVRREQQPKLSSSEESLTKKD